MLYFGTSDIKRPGGVWEELLPGRGEGESCADGPSAASLSVSCREGTKESNTLTALPPGPPSGSSLAEPNRKREARSLVLHPWPSASTDGDWVGRGTRTEGLMASSPVSDGGCA